MVEAIGQDDHAKYSAFRSTVDLPPIHTGVTSLVRPTAAPAPVTPRHRRPELIDRRSLRLIVHLFIGWSTSFVLMVITFQIALGALPSAPPKEVPAGVIAVVGWTNRLLVPSAWAWVVVVAWQGLRMAFPSHSPATRVWLTPAQSPRQAAARLYSRRTPPSRSRRSTRPVGSGITSAGSQGRRCSIPWCGRA